MVRGEKCFQWLPGVGDDLKRTAVQKNILSNSFFFFEEVSAVPVARVLFEFIMLEKCTTNRRSVKESTIIVE